MSSVSRENTRPEVLVRKYLFSRGLRFRNNVKGLPGKPDIVLKKYNTAIFVHGCFWHGHENCKRATIPKSNTNFWREKINKNKQRDRENLKQIESLGWHPITIWQCELTPLNKSLETLQQTIKEIHKAPKNKLI
jgi:DNA mismatch endonuclease (patch repair protein)